jgi:drug/metabolite transporter (DMT)-like permease
LKTYFFLILCVLFWSGNFILGRFIKDDIQPLEMAFFRWLFVTIIIFPVLIMNYNKILNSLKENLLIMVVLSILGITSFNTILYVGLTMTTATNALIINSSIPIIVLLLSFILLKQNININQIF